MTAHRHRLGHTCARCEDATDRGWDYTNQADYQRADVDGLTDEWKAALDAVGRAS